jgi:hypothetical protein
MHSITFLVCVQIVSIIYFLSHFCYVISYGIKTPAIMSTISASNTVRIVLNNPWFLWISRLVMFVHTIRDSISAVPHLELRFNREPVEIVKKNHKHLGLTFASDGNWTNHIDNIVNFSFKQINVLRKLQFTLSK